MEQLQAELWRVGQECDDLRQQLTRARAAAAGASARAAQPGASGSATAAGARSLAATRKAPSFREWREEPEGPAVMEGGGGGAPEKHAGQRRLDAEADFFPAHFSGFSPFVPPPGR